MTLVVVIDYGMGNLHSIAKALQHVASDAVIEVTGDPERIRAADRVVFPGVGAIRDCMHQIGSRGLIPVLTEVSALKPFFGVCLGMQALLSRSEENGGVHGLGLFEGEVVKFPDGLKLSTGENLKIPHMGWNRVRTIRSHPLFEGIEQGSWFYFVHSYYTKPLNDEDIAAVTDYSGEFASALIRNNVAAVQFHPEKSQDAGLRLLRNFLSWEPFS